MTDNSDSGDDVTAVVSTGVSSPERAGVAERLDPGDYVDRYVVLSEIGEGGMGIVYRAYDPKLRREVALKCLRSDALDRAAEARLVREAQVMAQLTHPNVVAVYDVEVGPHGLVLAMEYVRGQTLRTWVDTASNWRDVVARYLEAGRGLAAAHEAAIIHRDFKPANVLVSETGGVKVTDFGLAKGVTTAVQSVSGPASLDVDSGDPGPSFIDSESLDAPLTRADTVMGTPLYMSPEQHAGREADARSDQYAFCVSLWEGLCGKPPFGQDRSTVGKDKLGGAPPWPKSVDVPRAVVRAIERGLSPAPSRRWASMDDLLQALDHDPDRRRRRAIFVAGSVVLVGLVAGGGYGWSSQRRGVCADGAETMETVWSDARVANAHAAFEKRDRGIGDATWSVIEPRLTEYADAWVRARRDACEATRLRAEQSEAVMRLRTACLDRGLGRLEVAVEAFETAERATVDHAMAIAATVGSVDRCGDVEALRRTTSIAATAHPELQTDIDRLRLLAASEDAIRGAPLVESLERRVAEANVPDLRARFELAAGRLHAATFEPEQAEFHLTRAMEQALQHGPPHVAMEAATELVGVLGVDLGRRAEARWLARVAQGLARRFDAGGPAEAAVLVAKARVDAEALDFERAVSTLEPAIEMVRTGPEAELAEERINAELAAIWARRGDEEQARRLLESTRAQFEGRWGAGHPQTARALARIGRSLRLGGLGELAIATLEEARSYLDAAGWSESVDVARIWHELALTHAESDRTDMAMGVFETAGEKLVAALGSSHPLTLDAVADHARWAVASDELGKAAVLYAELLGQVEARHTKKHPRYVSTMVDLAAVRAAQGQGGESIKLYRRARTLVRDIQAPTTLRLEISLSLAELHAGLREGSDVIRYLEEARAYAGAEPDERTLARLAEVERLVRTAAG